METWREKIEAMQLDHVIYHDCRRLQFEHFRALMPTMISVMKPSDMIMFMDDDDLLLNLPRGWTEKVPRVGRQWIGVDVPSDVRLESLHEYPMEQIDDDFSGTICRFQHIQDYFKVYPVNESAARALEDVEFMKFLEEMENSEEETSSEPYIFRRIKEEGSAWAGALCDSLRDLINKYEDTLRSWSKTANL